MKKCEEFEHDAVMVSPLEYSVVQGNECVFWPTVSLGAIESAKKDVRSMKRRIDNRLYMLTSQFENMTLTNKNPKNI